jgi:predicted nucleic acid-binding protein
VPETTEAESLKTWYQSGSKVMTSSIAWYEFLCGPVSKQQVQVMRFFLTGGIIPFEETQATEASRLFNAVHRLRKLRVDSMIAATAITQKALLATSNHRDFQLFVPQGLQLVEAI